MPDQGAARRAMPMLAFLCGPARLGHGVGAWATLEWPSSWWMPGCWGLTGTDQCREQQRAQRRCLLSSVASPCSCTESAPGRSLDSPCGPPCTVAWPFLWWMACCGSRAGTCQSRVQQGAQCRRLLRRRLLLAEHEPQDGQAVRDLARGRGADARARRGHEKHVLPGPRPAGPGRWPPHGRTDRGRRVCPVWRQMQRC